MTKKNYCFTIKILVHSVFENVANSYDNMNDVMSLGIHRIWKDLFIQELAPTHGCRLLDSAGGTGDITFRYLKYLKNIKNPSNIQSHVTVCDINSNMLEVGKIRAERQGLTIENGFNIQWQEANAEKLPFDDDSFSAYTIAFGVRNVTHIDKVVEQKKKKKMLFFFIYLTSKRNYKKKFLSFVLKVVNKILGFRRSLSCSSTWRSIFVP